MSHAVEIAAAPQVREAPAERLERLFRAHRLRLWRLALRMTADGDDAQDLVQETYVRAAARLESLPAHAEEAWLVRTLVNLCRDRARRAGVRRSKAPELHARDRAAVAGEAPVLAGLEVERALAQLDVRRRAIFLLCELEGHTAREVADLVGSSAVTVRWHLMAARRTLRAWFREGR